MWAWACPSVVGRCGSCVVRGCWDLGVHIMGLCYVFGWALSLPAFPLLCLGCLSSVGFLALSPRSSSLAFDFRSSPFVGSLFVVAILWLWVWALFGADACLRTGPPPGCVQPFTSCHPSPPALLSAYAVAKRTKALAI